MEDAEGQWRTMEMESNMEIEKIWGQKEEEIQEGRGDTEKAAVKDGKERRQEGKQKKINKK